MDIEYRMNDVDKLRTDVVQDFLKMAIKPNWQKNLYEKAEEAVNTNHYADNYINAFETMRDKGIECYSIEDMDFSLIATVICYCDEIVKVKNKTRKELEKVREDRNLSRHLNGNEDDEELYLRGLLALCNLRSLVRAVDKYEISIGDKERLEFRNTYIPQIEELMDELDDERIELIQKTKKVKKDVETILSGIDEKTRSQLWIDMQELYWEHLRLDDESTNYNEFVVEASDSGIIYAHLSAAEHFRICKNYNEMIRRTRLLYDAKEELTPGDAHSIIDNINCFIKHSNTITPEISEMADSIIEKGFPVTKKEDGTYYWKSKKKRFFSSDSE